MLPSDSVEFQRAHELVPRLLQQISGLQVGVTGRVSSVPQGGPSVREHQVIQIVERIPNLPASSHERLREAPVVLKQVYWTRIPSNRSSSLSHLTNMFHAILNR